MDRRNFLEALAMALSAVALPLPAAAGVTSDLSAAAGDGFSWDLGQVADPHIRQSLDLGVL